MKTSLYQYMCWARRALLDPSKYHLSDSIFMSIRCSVPVKDCPYNVGVLYKDIVHIYESQKEYRIYYEKADNLPEHKQEQFWKETIKAKIIMGCKRRELFELYAKLPSNVKIFFWKYSLLKSIILKKIEIDKNE